MAGAFLVGRASVCSAAGKRAESRQLRGIGAWGGKWGAGGCPTFLEKSSKNFWNRLIDQYPQLAEAGSEVGHIAVAFDGVAGVAEELQVARGVQAAFGAGDDVVYG